MLGLGFGDWVLGFRGLGGLQASSATELLRALGEGRGGGIGSYTLNPKP